MYTMVYVNNHADKYINRQTPDNWILKYYNIKIDISLAGVSISHSHSNVNSRKRLTRLRQLTKR